MLEAETARKGAAGDSERGAFSKKKPSKSKKIKDSVKQDSSAMMINYDTTKQPETNKGKKDKSKKGDDYEDFVANMP